MDVTVRAPHLTAAFWRSRRSAAIAGIVFGVLLLMALTMLRIALSADSLQSLRTDPQRRTLIRLSLNLVPFAGLAFLWFIGVLRDQLGAVEDRLFSTAFLGSGLLFVAMLFVGAGTSTSLMATLAGTSVNAEVSYLGYLVGLTLLVAAGAYQCTQLVFPAWVLLVSLVILFDRPLSHDSHPTRGS
jgi:hypothetical protein